MKSAIFFQLILVHCLLVICHGESNEVGELIRRAEVCGNSECRDFTVLKRFNGYELRHYNASVWATVKSPAMEKDYWDDRSYEKETIKQLLSYMQGHNIHNLNMGMTVPLLKAHSKDTILVSFMLPANYSNNPPAPNDINIFFFTSPAGNVYVRSFSGFAYGFFGWRNHYETELEALSRDLHRDGQSFDNQIIYFTTDYNEPWQLFDRHNEVWFRQR